MMQHSVHKVILLPCMIPKPINCVRRGVEQKYQDPRLRCAISLFKVIVLVVATSPTKVDCTSIILVPVMHQVKLCLQAQRSRVFSNLRIHKISSGISKCDIKAAPSYLRDHSYQQKHREGCVFNEIRSSLQISEIRIEPITASRISFRISVHV